MYGAKINNKFPQMQDNCSSAMALDLISSYIFSLKELLERRWSNNHGSKPPSVITPDPAQKI